LCLIARVNRFSPFRFLDVKDWERLLVAILPNDILIVDDHKLARTTVRELLHWHEFEICGEAASGKEAVEKVRELHPGIVLLDINMPEKNGIQTAYEIRQIAPSTKIVFLTVHKSHIEPSRRPD
jgi:DNA-binding NarL/FixJ family response regulator